jgi:hypothetical protein
MKNKDKRPDDAAKLRRRAEKKLKTRPADATETLRGNTERMLQGDPIQ